MPIYDPTIISYDDDPIEIVYEDAAKKELYQSPAFYYKGKIVTPLIEIPVDPGYELERVHPKELRLLEWLRSRFNERREPIAYYDLKAACYSYGDEVGEKWGAFNILHALRHLWRYGEIRRFIRGKAKAVRKIGRGESYGVHYMLWPKKD